MVGVIILLAIAIIGIAWLMFTSPQPVSSHKIQALTEVLYEALYQVGYDDQMAGLPERSWLNQKPSDQFVKVARSIYQHGRQDALEGRSSIVDKIRDNREKQIIILKEMIANLGTKGVNRERRA